MAKIQKKYSFSNSRITFEDGKYIITEYGWDTIKSFNFSDILEEISNVDGVAVTICVESEPDGIAA